MTRDEHLAWAKARALRYVDEGELQNAVVSMGSDLNKHAELTYATNGMLLQLGLLYVRHGDTAGVRRWIEGFN
jgi:hypothetical protein